MKLLALLLPLLDESSERDTNFLGTGLGAAFAVTFVAGRLKLLALLLPPLLLEESSGMTGLGAGLGTAFAVAFGAGGLLVGALNEEASDESDPEESESERYPMSSLLRFFSRCISKTPFPFCNSYWNNAVLQKFWNGRLSSRRQ